MQDAQGTDMMTSHLQLAPGMRHQVAALISILRRYEWRRFGVLTTDIAGHDDFVQAVRDGIAEEEEVFAVQDVFKATEETGWDLSAVAASEVRILLLYATQAEAAFVMRRARRIGLAGPNYMWLVTQSVIGNPHDRSSSRRSLPAGMMGIMRLKP